MTIEHNPEGNSMNTFTNKVALVTGGTSGIGSATALAFAREGAKVIVSGRREKEGNEIVLLTTAMKTKEWVAVHRKHHAKCETREDLHSPQVLGLNKVLWQGAVLYHHEAKYTDTLNTYGIGTPED